MPVHDTCDRQLRHRLRLLNQLDIRADDAEMVAQVDQRDLDAVARDAVKYQSGRIFLPADSERMNLDFRFVCRK